MTVSKEMRECYLVRNRGEYASICVAEWTRPTNQGSDIQYCGEIMIHSSFGSWGNAWMSCGEPFKKFLLGLGFDYLFTKFMGNELWRFDGHSSLDAVLEQLIQHRREELLSKTEARELWDALVSERERAECSLHDFVTVMNEVAEDKSHAVQSLLSEPWEMQRTKHDCQAEGFWRDLWPQFIAALKAEEPEPAVA